MRTYDVTVRVYVQDGEHMPTMSEPRARLRQFNVGYSPYGHHEWDGSVINVTQLQYSDAEMVDKYAAAAKKIYWYAKGQNSWGSPVRVDADTIASIFREAGLNL